MSDNFSACRQGAQEIFAKFPNVPFILIEDFITRLRSNPNSVIIVDVRPEAETAISMIPGSITKDEFESRYCRDGRIAIDCNSTVYVYCTMGYRSAKYCQLLIGQGVPCMNMEGIVMATHVMENLVHDGEETKRVHTFGSSWNFVADGYDPVYYTTPSYVVPKVGACHSSGLTVGNLKNH